MHLYQEYPPVYEIYRYPILKMSCSNMTRWVGASLENLEMPIQVNVQ